MIELPLQQLPSNLRPQDEAGALSRLPKVTLTRRMRADLPPFRGR